MTACRDRADFRHANPINPVEQTQVSTYIFLFCFLFLFSFLVFFFFFIGWTLDVYFLIQQTPLFGACCCYPSLDYLDVRADRILILCECGYIPDDIESRPFHFLSALCSLILCPGVNVCLLSKRLGS